MAISTPPLRGPWASAWSVVASPWTAWIVGLALAAAAASGLVAEPGQHPAEGLAMQLPAALLPFVVIAGAIATGRRHFGLAVVWSIGAVVAFVGGGMAGGEAGVTDVGGARPTESYTRPVAGRTAASHLGGQLTASLSRGGATLNLGTKDQLVGRVAISLDGVSEARIGQWATHIVDVAPGDEPAFARLKMTPRAGGDPVELAVRTGSGAALPDGTQIAVLRLSSDFGRALGGAAQIQIDTDAGSSTAWHFVGAGDMDERLGTAPWSIRLLGVETEPRMHLGVRRAGPTGPAMFGFGLMALALLGMAAGGRR